MKNVLFICADSFGKLTDNYYYTLLLKEKYNVTYIGFNEGGKTKNVDGIKIIHVEFGNNKILNRILYFKVIYRELKSKKYDFIFINYFIFCSIILFFERKRAVVDIRSSFIISNAIKRFLYNAILFFEVRLFKNITIITESLRKYLHIPKSAHILPLGGPSLPIFTKNFDTLRILYVGTFHERDITMTIVAFSRFVKEYGTQIIASYTIIGFGSKIETDKIVATISELGMENHISFRGEVRYPELIEHLKEHNVGISYIPLKGFFDCQPPTKTFEYLLSGMVVLATSTKENKLVINDSNGVIINDSIDDIFEGLKTIFIQRLSYNSEKIQIMAQQYSWNGIIDNNLIPYIESFNCYK